MPGELAVEKGGSSESQQQRIRASRLRNEAASGVRIVFCFTMLLTVEEYQFPAKMSIRSPFLQ
jgi:hypothetical protein